VVRDGVGIVGYPFNIRSQMISRTIDKIEVDQLLVLDSGVLGKVPDPTSPYLKLSHARTGT
jgi:hypothetical protein